MNQVIEGRTADAIAQSIESALQRGRLGPGDVLPTIRQLAGSLRVSPVTVAAAYRRLHARGLLVAGGRRGTRIRAHPATATLEPAPPVPLVQEGLVDLATGNPDPDLLPPLDPVVRAYTAAPHLYGQMSVLPALGAFAANEFAEDGVPVRSVAVLGGGLDAIERLLREHLRAGDRVAVEDPALPALLDVIGASGFVVRGMAVDAEGPLPDGLARALADGVRAVLVTARAHNPTGAALSPSRAADLARVLHGRGDVLVIESDPAGPVAGVPLASIAASGRPRWAVVRSVSKFLGPDLRLAVVAGDERTIARAQGRQALGPRWVSHLLQHLTVSLWSDPANGRRLARAADVYAHRRSAVTTALARHGIDVAARSGFNLWIPVRDEAAAVQGLAARGWAVASGGRFRVRSAAGIRVTTSALDVSAAERFAEDCAAVCRLTTGPLA